MPLTLRRLLNRLPIPHGGSDAIYIRSSWHKPTPFDQLRSQAPFRPMVRTVNLGRGLRWQRRGRSLVRWGVAFAAAWLVIESARGLALL